MNFESRDTETSMLRFYYSQEKQVVPFTVLGNQKQLFLVVLHAEVTCRSVMI